MTSANDINLISQQSIDADVKRRSTFSISLMLVIVLIAVFLGLFVLEFSRILTLAGRVNHAPPDTRLHETAFNWCRSW